jgi:hypothetical protein
MLWVSLNSKFVEDSEIFESTVGARSKDELWVPSDS